jgi:hypothetical protein
MSDECEFGTQELYIKALQFSFRTHRSTLSTDFLHSSLNISAYEKLKGRGGASSPESVPGFPRRRIYETTEK